MRIPGQEELECVTVNNVIVIGYILSSAVARDLSHALNSFLQSQRLNGSPASPDNDAFIDNPLRSLSTTITAEANLISALPAGSAPNIQSVIYGT